MGHSSAFWLTSVLGALLASCGNVEQVTCPSLECACPGSGFEYSGQCSQGKLVCECPDAAPQPLTCPFASCTTNSGEARGSWKLAAMCPRSPAGAEACGSVVALKDLDLKGFAHLDSLEASVRATGTLVTGYGPACGKSCEAIEATLADDAHCEAGADGVACLCSSNYELELQNAFVAGETFFATPPNSATLFQGHYCQNGNTLTVSTDAFELQFERAGCVLHSISCNGAQRMECGPDGELVPLENCPEGYTCLNGGCIPVCEPQTLYCSQGYEYLCPSSGIQNGEGRQACGDNVACVEGSGCQGARKIELGSNLNAGSLDQVVLAGEVLHIARDATLLSFSVQANLYAEQNPLDWQVYEAAAEKGPFHLIYSAPTTHGPGGGEYQTPPLSLPVVAGRYYLLGVGALPTTIFLLGGLGEGGSYGAPLGITWFQTQPEDGFTINKLTTDPGVLIGQALFEP